MIGVTNERRGLAPGLLRLATLSVATLVAGCAERAPPEAAGPALPTRAPAAPRDRAPSRPAPAPLPDSFEALRAEALALAAETRRRHGDSTETLDLEASIRARFGDLAAAAAIWEDWLATHPETPEAHLWLGKLARERGDDDAAIVHLRTAFEARPELPGAQVLLGAALVNAGCGAEAIDVLSRDLPATAGNPNRSILLGHALLQAGDAPAARQAFERAVAIAPGMPHAIYGLATACARAGDAEASRRHFATFAALKEKGLENDRAQADSRLDDLPWLTGVMAKWYAAAGRIEWLRGDRAAAQTRYLRALDYDPAQREAVSELVAAWRREGRDAEAARLVERARSRPAPVPED